MIEFKKCKGTGQAINSGCGKEVKAKTRRYGLCDSCYYHWLTTTEPGKVKMQKAVLKAKSIERRKEQANLKKEKEKLKTHKDHLKDLQKVFNEFIRTRDADQPCISCGTSDQTKQYDAGHFRSVGANPELRLNEDNVHKQCRKCNGYWGGNLIEYRKGLLDRIGPDRLKIIEGPNEPIKLSVPEIKEKIKYYKNKTKQLCKAQQED